MVKIVVVFVVKIVVVFVVKIVLHLASAAQYCYQILGRYYFACTRIIVPQ